MIRTKRINGNFVVRSAEIGGALVTVYHRRDVRNVKAATVGVEVTTASSLLEYEDSAVYIPAQTAEFTIETEEERADLFELFKRESFEE